MNLKITDAVSIITNKLEEWLKQLIELLPSLVIAIVVAVLFVFIARFTRNILDKVLGRVSHNKAVNNLLVTIAYVAVLTIGVLIALRVVALDGVVTSLLAGVGIVGLALGFAFKILLLTLFREC